MSYLEETKDMDLIK